MPKPAKPKKPKRNQHPKGGRRNISIARYEAALRKHAGIHAMAAQELGVSRQAVSTRIANSERLQAACKEVEDTVMDAAEGVIIGAIVKDKDQKMARWYAERKGRDRGYGNRTEVENRFSDDAVEAIVASFGGDPAKLRAFREALDPSPAG